MRLPGPDAVHLTYCTNIHPAQTWPEVDLALRRHVPAVRDRVAPEQRFGIGLRLSDQAARGLLDPPAFERFSAWLAATGAYVFTLNGFPYGPFHGTSVKEAVYRPDWSEPERSSYTSALVSILARLVGPHDGIGTISTVPVCFGPRATPDRIDGAVDRLLASACGLAQLHREGGPELVLALEPEPFCRLATIDETVAFFRDHLWSRSAIDRVAASLGCDRATAEASLVRHLGVCLDTCHAAVEFETPRQAWNRLRAAGLRIAKIQVTAGLRIAPVDAPAIEALQAFADDVYLHQVVSRRGAALERFVDLPQAMAAWRAEATEPDEWRVHFHVPVYADPWGRLGNTRPFVAELLELARRDPACPHLEVETYTWDVLPPEHRLADVDSAIARELAWVIERWTS